MGTKEDIINEINTVADLQSDTIKVALGTPGSVVTIGTEDLDTGQGIVSGAAFNVLVEGIAEYIDSQGVGDVSTIKSKLNELIGEFNQLLADYNSSTVPSTASTVTTIP